MLRKGVLTNREKLCLKYRWEFLRRNKDYRNDFRFIVQKLHAIDIIRIKYPEHTVQSVLKILSKWDLMNPIPPSLSFEDLIKSDKKSKSLYLDSLIVNEQAIDCSESPESLSLKDLYIKSSMVNIHVDMKFPKEKIIDEFNLLVDRWQKRLKKMTKGLPHPEPVTRMQIDQYAKYLKVYDAYVKGLSFEKLAKKFYPGYIESSGKAYAQRRITRDLNGCLRLIHGGYKQIR